ncbi:serine O-acetyltransferase [Mobiluncus mulieris 28-1]|uniref:Serine acetyltransferase n=2 Tax=Mobiluncus mulieris TaxID=2052 RepID=E0QQF0_9ACTO|nr:serine O-acetyltransferase [Mobiluncus mulieris ATCC 35243]EEZ91761.1 serine O-acetyltransferase [Mobiluncus mulieris 28-1]EFM46253.1 serine O-acetyltransferase [Mobiluncus mulieris ATCC 35239]EFN92624.1 serine O-acetyltransferase [Mobiluncus mulieris FB024-16]MCU9969662.1 serine O-acetyltransferase [Mobiluncus mulieris]
MNPKPAPPAHVPASRMRVWDLILEDLDTALQRDPAARTRFEVAVSYPGVHALWAHRVASAMWRKGMRIPARLLQQLTRTMTGVDIHPAACIGRRLFIDHATGVVIGETAVVGEDCLIFHGVTLGGQRMVHGKRHPTVGNHVMIGAGAKVLGAIHIGDDAKIGANAVVVKDVPSGGIAIGVPAKLRKPKCQVSEDMNDMNIDPSLFI